MRYRPATMEEVRKCLDFCAADMKVDVKSDVPTGCKDRGRPLFALLMAARLDIELLQPR